MWCCLNMNLYFKQFMLTVVVRLCLGMCKPDRFCLINHILSDHLRHSLWFQGNGFLGWWSPFQINLYQLYFHKFQILSVWRVRVGCKFMFCADVDIHYQINCFQKIERWHSVEAICYLLDPTCYHGNIVIDDWLIFQRFAKWKTVFWDMFLSNRGISTWWLLWIFYETSKLIYDEVSNDQFSFFGICRTEPSSDISKHINNGATILHLKQETAREWSLLYA